MVSAITGRAFKLAELLKARIYILAMKALLRWNGIWSIAVRHFTIRGAFVGRVNHLSQAIIRRPIDSLRRAWQLNYLHPDPV